MSPLRQRFYKWVVFPLSLPIGVPFAIGMWIWSKFVTYEPFSWREIPGDAILYSTHTEVYATCWNPQFSHRKTPIFVVGFHGFTPYLWIPFHTVVAGISWEIYSRFLAEKPSSQILGFLKRRSKERFFLMTDAGGPYGKVRPSLIKLSQHSGRSLVAFRHHVSRSIEIFQHRIPLPGSRVSIRFSPVITAQELKGSDDPAELLQRRFDEVGAPSRS